jgi:predicted nucleic acid-binding protein
VLAPIEEPPPGAGASPQAGEAAWPELTRLGIEIARGWKSPRSSPATPIATSSSLASKARASRQIAPTLLLPEVAAIIRRGRGDARLARILTLVLSRLPHWVLAPVNPALAQQAVAVAAQHGLRGSDAVYATVALRFGSPPVTLDRDQRERAASVLTAITPADALAGFS